MLIVPYEVDTLFTRRPIANFAIVAITTIVSLMAFFGNIGPSTIETMVLSGWDVSGLFGHMLLHGGWMHLIGNMMMLWIFGNAIAGIMNQFAYVLLYLFTGLIASSAQIVFDGSPAIGASGALSGIMGVYLAVYPTNHVNVFWLWMIRAGTFEISGWLLIVAYFALDLFGLLGSTDSVAHWAHVGGTVAGFLTGLALLKCGLFDRENYDLPTALDFFSGRARM